MAWHGKKEKSKYKWCECGNVNFTARPWCVPCQNLIRHLLYRQGRDVETRQQEGMEIE